MVVKEKYLCSMKIYTNWYWNQQPKHRVITVPTRTIIHPQLEVDAVTDFQEIPTSICTRAQAKMYISRQPICFTYSDYNFYHNIFVLCKQTLTIIVINNPNSMSSQCQHAQ